MTPERIQRKRTKGWKAPEGAVYVGRPSKWGNHYRVGYPDPVTREPMTAAQVVWWFAADLDPVAHGAAVLERRAEIRRELAGKTLMCWCKEGEPCHGDVLLKTANPEVKPINPWFDNSLWPLKRISNRVLSAVDPFEINGADLLKQSAAPDTSLQGMIDAQRPYFIPTGLAYDDLGYKLTGIDVKKYAAWLKENDPEQYQKQVDSLALLPRLFCGDEKETAEYANRYYWHRWGQHLATS